MRTKILQDRSISHRKLVLPFPTLYSPNDVKGAFWEVRRRPGSIKRRGAGVYRPLALAVRLPDSLLGRDMRASMTPNVLAQSPKTHSNPTINRLLPRRNRALLLQQQTTARQLELSEEKAGAKPSLLSQKRSSLLKKFVSDWSAVQKSSKTRRKHYNNGVFGP